MNSKTVKSINKLLSKGVKSVEDFLDSCMIFLKRYAKPIAILAIIALIYKMFIHRLLKFFLIGYLTYIVYNFGAGYAGLITWPINIHFAGCYLLYLLGRK